MPGHHSVAVRLNEQRLSLKRREKRTIQVWASRKRMLLAIWAIIFAAIAKYIYHWIDDYGWERRKEILVSMCDERARMLQDQFGVSVNHVHALAILVSTFHHHKQPSAIDQETFAEYTARTAFERPLLSGVAYAKRVVNSEREWFERQQGWTIKTMKNRDPSPVQSEYAPVIFSQETVSYIESLDMMSGEEDRGNIIRARATGKAVLTSPFRLLGSDHLGVVLTFPVYRSSLPPDPTVDQRVEATEGYLGGAFDVESLVENLLRQLSGNEAIVVNVYDVTSPSMPLIMYGPQHPEGDMSLSHVSMLDFGDPFRKHQMSCRYLRKAPTPWTAILASCGFFLIFILVGYILYAAVTHIAKVDEDFCKMEELKVQAEAADVAKSQFLATVSHEIRTPMNGVLGMLAMLLDTDLDSSQKDYAQTAQACGKALINLINEVLDRAKIEAGKLELETVPFDVRSILDDVLSLFSGKSRSKGIELAVFVSDKVPEILVGDPGRFRQIITNLVGNSVKFTERGHIFVQVHLAEHTKMAMAAKDHAGLKSGSSKVEVISGSNPPFNTLSGSEAADNRNSWETFRLLLSDGEFRSDASDMWMHTDETSDNVTLMVSVEDTGIGIPLHAQERVFTPFMQADSSTSRHYGGTGIGLSISRCLVELMGGQINFISRPKIGSTFTFTAVFKRCDKNGCDLKRPLSEALPKGCFTGKKAIVVDGRPVRGAVTKYHLKRLGVTVEIVSSVKAALGAPSRQNGCLKPGIGRPDMILVEKDSWTHGVDVILPERILDQKQNGYVVELPKLILLSTTSITAVESEKAKAAGFVDTVIMKPLRASMIAACLQQVLGVGNKKQQGNQMLKGSAFLHSLLSGKNILVVDDNRVNRRVAAGALKKYGANVECAESGKAALVLLQLPHKFDACFMDVQMPEMDGFEATRQIRLMENVANERIKNEEAVMEEGPTKATWHVPVLAMTADVIQATHERCLKCGMDGYVSKPFEEEQLYQAVAKFFESKPETDS
ncbi:histidine kinase 4 [Magnolia sinica]|uniref:histidine kinase 4 n=1 Tax=Magnolia sinica TaxID=86752 RepID=UPI002659649A|nr:histidine kinase 4 [Magnolia sinica]XP_058080034.1 histidine kinase 4 [Magnolia sinica]